MALDRREVDPQATLFDTGLRDEFRQRIVDPQTRILEVDGVDRVAGDGYLDARRSHHALVAESDHTRQPSARAAVHHAIEINEADRLAGTVRMGHTGAETARNERE